MEIIENFGHRRPYVSCDGVSPSVIASFRFTHATPRGNHAMQHTSTTTPLGLALIQEYAFAVDRMFWKTLSGSLVKRLRLKPKFCLGELP
jgi:hypothetical protein